MCCWEVSQIPNQYKRLKNKNQLCLETKIIKVSKLNR